jgi:hypothetical protein
MLSVENARIVSDPPATVFGVDLSEGLIIYKVWDLFR